MAVDGLRIERDGDVLRVTFDRPERLNALTAAIVNALAQAIEDAPSQGVRTVVMTGTGRAFSSGADVGPDGAPPGMETLEAANRVVRAITQSPLPVVAAVNGIAAGVGCSFALAADLAIASDSAAFMLAFTKIGLMPDGAASILVPAAVGRARAMRMALLAEKVDATTAAEWGLIALTVPAADFEARVESMVQQLAAGAPLALKATKAVVNGASMALLEEIMGIEAVKSSTPSSCREKIKEVLKIIMKGTEADVIRFISEFREEFKTLSFEEVAFPRGCNGLSDYRDKTTIYKKKGTPIHVRGALVYNNLLQARRSEEHTSELQSH